MNSGLIGALGAAPLQTVKNRLGSFQGTRHLNLLLPKDGTLVLGPPPDETVKGGNRRNTNTVDLQFRRTAADQIAGGPDSVCIGRNNKVPYSPYTGDSVLIGVENLVANSRAFCFGVANNNAGTNSVAIGTGNKIDYYGAHSIAIGAYARTRDSGQIAFSSGNQFTPWAPDDTQGRGSVQRTFMLLKAATTNNIPLEALTFEGAYHIPSGKAVHGIVTIVGAKTDGTAVARYIRQVALKNTTGTTSLVGSIVTIGNDESAGTSISITADDIDDSLDVKVIGINSEEWFWTVSLDFTETAF